MSRIITLVHCLVFLIIFSVAAYAQSPEKRRVLVLTDIIEKEPDDAQSVVRFLTYANQWEVKGLIATTSIHNKDQPGAEKIREIIKAYGQVQPNLLKHQPDYPTAEALLATVKEGIPAYGMQGVGEGKDSEGSDWILRVLEEEDERPVWVLVWGGPSCLTQALWKMQRTKTPEEQDKIIAKLRVYTISDQDDSGPWIRKHFPDIFYIVSPGYEPGGAGGYHYATWPGISGDTFHGRFRGANREVVSGAWLRENIQQGHGPLGREYPDVAYLMEGDSPSFLHLVENGLNVPEHPDYGGWGGRYEQYTPRTRKWFFEPETRPIWSDTQDEVLSAVDSQYHTSNHATIWRWRQAFQHDFAARMDWCVKEYEAANHPPEAMLTHPNKLTVRSGDTVNLNASPSTDPDGDTLAYRWFPYREAGSYLGWIRLTQADQANISFTAPKVDQAETVHIILEVTDDGNPSLTRYQRVIVSILPQ